MSNVHTKTQPLITGKIDVRKHMHLKLAFTVVLDSGGTDGIRQWWNGLLCLCSGEEIRDNYVFLY